MPDDSFLRFEDDECDIYLPILERVYRYESNQISGSHGGGRRHTQLRWTRQDMLNFVVADVREDAVLVAQRETRFDELIERMVAEKHLMRYASGGPTTQHESVNSFGTSRACMNSRSVMGLTTQKNSSTCGTASWTAFAGNLVFASVRPETFLQNAWSQTI